MQIIEDQQRRADEERRRNLWLSDMKIKAILDIGAHTGQFAEKLSKTFPDAMIYSFEPLTEYFEELIWNFKDYKLFKAYNIALGEKTER